MTISGKKLLCRVRMKGFALKYVFYAVILIVFLVVSISIMTNFAEPPDKTKPEVVINVSYICSILNGTEIGAEELEDILYGFLTKQCKNFTADLEYPMTFDDIERLVKKTDDMIEVYEISECTDLQTGTNTVLVAFDKTSYGIKITIKGTENSNILICKP
jgi:hypothetical protein